MAVRNRQSPSLHESVFVQPPVYVCSCIGTIKLKFRAASRLAERACGPIFAWHCPENNQETKMKFALIGAVALVAASSVTPALAQAVIEDPGYCAQFYPNANCQNLGPGNPYDNGGYWRNDWRNGQRNDWRNGNASMPYHHHRPRHHKTHRR
jgi:hypothetical protein